MPISRPCKSVSPRSWASGWSIIGWSFTASRSTAPTDSAKVRAAARIALIGLALAACLPAHYLARAATGRSRWPRRFLGLAARASGVRLTVSGTPLDGPILLVANHRSWLDILTLAGASGCIFVSKAEVRRWAVVGWLAGLNDTLFVERTRRGAVRGQADALRGALEAGRTVALFPEGTTNEADGLLPFRASLFASVLPPPPQVRVQPVRIDYGGAAADLVWPDEEDMLGNALRILGRRGTIAARLSFLDPIDPAAFDDRKALAATAQAALERSGAIG
ncbi:lysophospholipid acyltransferase family protein [Sphingomonas quercus]|uniref:1-acyl-sn-glycerol-3-phosphate acyltransferase n=1 Tax=Sphingomonas quercus TaxID=2842451 RepID=A0ABS6BPL3_9SPHN|nr:lysophospholipid acyltransferase family protein [Sphingomonas quercus]MBU3079150.1 1-acyl-sn-glycerol-3-phosphate acyltransferase [Sphingomonas quercus]